MLNETWSFDTESVWLSAVAHWCFSVPEFLLRDLTLQTNTSCQHSFIATQISLRDFKHPFHISLLSSTLVFSNIRRKTPVVTGKNIYFILKSSTMDELSISMNSFLVHCCFYSIILGPDQTLDMNNHQTSSVEWRLTKKIHYCDHLVWFLDDGRSLSLTLFCPESLIFLMRCKY